jgi:hypothetical protein
MNILFVGYCKNGVGSPTLVMIIQHFLKGSELQGSFVAKQDFYT